MSKQSLYRGILFLMSLTGIALSSGCSTTLSIYKYPAFFQEPGQYESMTINHSGDRGEYADILQRSVIKESIEYGGYDYVSGSYYDRTDLSATPYITGTDQWYNEEIRTRDIVYDVPVLDADGNPLFDAQGHHIMRQEIETVEYPWFTRGAEVNAAVSVIRVYDNANLASYTARGVCTDSDEFRDNLASYHSLYKCATKDAADSIASSITPHWSAVSVSNSDLLVIGKVNNSGKMKEKTSGWKIDETIDFKVWFPQQARMNLFGFDIVAANDTSTVLFSQQIYWEADGAIIISVPVSQLVEKSGGATKYYARIINARKVAYKDDFKLSL